MFWRNAKRFASFFTVSASAHAPYCPTMYSGDDSSIGRRNSTTLHPASAPRNRPLRRTKKKNASPTMPYSLTKVPTAIINAAQPSCPSSISTKARISSAAMATLNCAMLSAVNSSLAQNQAMKIRPRRSMGSFRTATNSSPAIANSHSTSPISGGQTANGATTQLNTGP